MNKTLILVLYMGLLTWLCLLAASLIRARAWTWTGTLLAFGNRDQMPEASPLAGRAERTARNTMENFVLFAVVALVAQAAGAGATPAVVTGAEVFFWARLVFVPVYYAGIVYLRTAVWAVSIVGLAMMLRPLL